MKNIYIDKNNTLQWSYGNMALAYNLLQQISLEKGEDKPYSQTGITWYEIARTGDDAFPYINGAISYGYPNNFLTKLTTINIGESYLLEIKESPDSLLLKTTIEVAK